MIITVFRIVIAEPNDFDSVPVPADAEKKGGNLAYQTGSCYSTRLRMPSLETSLPEPKRIQTRLWWSNVLFLLLPPAWFNQISRDHPKAFKFKFDKPHAVTIARTELAVAGCREGRDVAKVV